MEPMSRPASLRPSSSPILARQKQTGGKKLELDWEHIELSNNHNANTDFNIMDLTHLRIQLVEAERLGKTSAVRKIRREISRIQENQLAIHATFCGGCGYYQHNCRCEGLEEGSRSTKYRRRTYRKAAVRVLHRILNQVHEEILAEEKAQEDFNKRNRKGNR
jgi:hypothetical protein